MRRYKQNLKDLKYYPIKDKENKSYVLIFL